MCCLELTFCQISISCMEGYILSGVEEGELLEGCLVWRGDVVPCLPYVV